MTWTGTTDVAGEGVPPRWMALAGALGAFFLGGVFFLAVWGLPPVRLGKVADPEAFAQVIAIEGLDILLSPFQMAVLAIGIEAAVAFFLLLGVRRLWVLVPTALLVAFFLVLTGRAYLAELQGEKVLEASCGCFGNLVDRTPGEAFWQDVLLLVPALLLSFLGRSPGAPSVPPARTILAGILATATAALAAKAPDLPLDDVATRLRPGLRVADLCTGSGRERLCLAGEALLPWLTEGKHVLVIADLKDPDFIEAVASRVEELAAFTARPDAPVLVLLHSGTKEDRFAFEFQSRAPPFEYQDVPPSLLRPLYRRLPRTFVVQDGVVRRTFPGLPPVADLEP